MFGTVETTGTNLLRVYSSAGHAYAFLFVQFEVNRANSAADMNSIQPARQFWTSGPGRPASNFEQYNLIYYSCVVDFRAAPRARPRAARGSWVHPTTSSMHCLTPPHGAHPPQPCSHPPHVRGMRGMYPPSPTLGVWGIKEWCLLASYWRDLMRAL